MREATNEELQLYDSTQRKYIRVNTAINLLVYLSDLSDLELPFARDVHHYAKELEKALNKYLCLEFPWGLKEVEKEKERKIEEEKKRVALIMKKRKLLDEIGKIEELEALTAK